MLAILALLVHGFSVHILYYIFLLSFLCLWSFLSFVFVFPFFIQTCSCFKRHALKVSSKKSQFAFSHLNLQPIWNLFLCVVKGKKIDFYLFSHGQTTVSTPAIEYFIFSAQIYSATLCVFLDSLFCWFICLSFYTYHSVVVWGDLNILVFGG